MTSLNRREILSWVALVAVVAGILVLNAADTEQRAAQPVDPLRIRPELRLLGRYCFGTARLLGTSAPAAGLVDELSEQLTTPAERVAFAVLVAELTTAEAGRERLDALAGEEGLPEEIEVDVGLVYRLLAEPPETLTDDENAALVARYGWFAELALSRGDADRARVVEPALRLTFVIVLAFLGVCTLGLVGLVLLILAKIRAQRGDLIRGYLEQGSTDDEDRVPFLETGVLFLAGMTALSILAGALQAATGGPAQALIVLVLPALAWPLACGTGWPALRRAAGWIRGRGLVTEMACGVVGYVAGLPILGFGLLGSLVLSGAVEVEPYHPILDWVQGADLAGIAGIYLLACGWAPLVEETVFRGQLYHYLRGRFGVAGAAVGQGVIFAAIHPQGLVGLPVLVALAVVLALIREWRGSLVGCVTVHALHNGLAVTLLLLLFR